MFFKRIIPFLIFFTLSSPLFARSYVGHLGLGVSTQLMNKIPAISIKNYTSDSFAWGAMLNFSTQDNIGGWGAGIKGYKNFFAEPNLFFFGGLMFGVLNRKQVSGGSKTGIQIDLTAGSEFFLPGVESIGLSFETGLSMNTLDEFVIKTAGYTFVSAAVHFYL